MTKSLKQQFPLLIFDWDGTLVDSIERIVTSLQYASKQVTGKNISDLQSKNVIGLGLMEAITNLHPELHENGQTIELTRIADVYRQHFLYDNPVPAPLFTGVNELLKELDNEGYTMAISTGKSRHGLEMSIAEHKIGDYFSTTLCADENKSKPHPEMLHKILDELNFTAADALMIGDSEHDLMMANNANMRSIGVTYGVQNAETLQKYNPLICLHNITELSGFLTHN